MTTASTSQSRAVSIGLVVVLHIFVIWAFASGLAHQMIELLPQNINVNIIPEQKKAEPPPPPPPDFKIPPPTIPPPDVIIDMTNTTSTNAISAITATADHPPVPSRHNFIPDDQYPAMSLQLGEAGRLSLKVLVLEDGSVGEAQVATSSGFARLDDTAATYVKAHFHYSPALKDGKPIQQWILIGITWKIPKGMR